MSTGKLKLNPINYRYTEKEEHLSYQKSEFKNDSQNSQWFTD